MIKKENVKDVTLKVLISIRDEISGLREDTNARFRELEQDMSEMKQDMSAMKQDIAFMKQDIASVKQDMKAVAAHIKKTGIGSRDSGLVWYNEENGTRDPGLGVRRCEKALKIAS